MLRAKPGQNVSQMYYAKRGIITPEMEFIAIRENQKRKQWVENEEREQRLTGNSYGASLPQEITPEFVISESSHELIFIIIEGFCNIKGKKKTFLQKASWALNNANEYLLDKYIELCNILKDIHQM